jgi:hypothetical protein
MKYYAIAAFALSLTGCASVMNDVTHPVKIETYNAAGQEVAGASCALENDKATQTITTPTIANVRRSDKDLQLTCTKVGELDGKAAAVSRANAGLAGNIILGGGIGAIVDHNRGTAYTYPQWIRVVMGRFTTFDRKSDVDGQVNLGEKPAVTGEAPASPPITR